MANEVADLKTLNTSLYAAYQQFLTQVFEAGSLDDKTKAAVSVAAALAFGNQETLSKVLPIAKEAGLTNDDIGHVAAIVDVTRLESQQVGEPQAGGGGGGRSSCC